MFRNMNRARLDSVVTLFWILTGLSNHLHISMHIGVIPNRIGVVDSLIYR